MVHHVYQNIDIICWRPEPTKNLGLIINAAQKKLLFSRKQDNYRVALGSLFYILLDTFQVMFTKYVCAVNILNGLYKYKPQIPLIFIILSTIV